MVDDILFLSFRHEIEQIREGINGHGGAIGHHGGRMSEIMCREALDDHESDKGIKGHIQDIFRSGGSRCRCRCGGGTGAGGWILEFRRWVGLGIVMTRSRSG